MDITNNSMKIYLFGRQAMEECAFEKAYAAFHWAACLDPSNPLYTHAAASAAYEAGDQQEAERLYRRAVNDTEAVFGRAHPQVAAIARGLLQLYKNQGRHEDARLLSERTAETAET